MKFRLALFCLILLVIAGSALSADQPRYLGITFVSTNDLHGRLWPFDLAPDPAKNYPGEKNIGGAARRATVINGIRAEARTPVFVLDIGDTTYSHTVLGRAYLGAADIAVMNAIGYDAMAPGNHEFNLRGPEVLRNKKDSEFPWVCANMVYEKTGEPFAEPYIIREVNGVRVAFFGLINDLPNREPGYYVGAPELGLKVLDATEISRKLVPKLRQKADVIVLLSHLGRGPDAAIAKAVPGIDVILGGHSHSVLRTPDMIKVAEPSARSLGVVPVIQAGEWGRHVSKTRVVFRRDESTRRYNLMSCKGELIAIDSTIPDDPAIVQMLTDWTARIPPPPAPAAK